MPDHPRDERRAWVAFAAARGNWPVTAAAQWADHMLAEYRKRFPGDEGPCDDDECEGGCADPKHADSPAVVGHLDVGPVPEGCAPPRIEATGYGGGCRPAVAVQAIPVEPKRPSEADQRDASRYFLPPDHVYANRLAIDFARVRAEGRAEGFRAGQLAMRERAVRTACTRNS